MPRQAPASTPAAADLPQVSSSSPNRDRRHARCGGTIAQVSASPLPHPVCCLQLGQAVFLPLQALQFRLPDTRQIQLLAETPPIPLISLYPVLISITSLSASLAFRM